MTRSPSTEPAKPSKRKGTLPLSHMPPQSTDTTSYHSGTRSVSTLTPSQLARKRANDREAQRAIRQRTKEHIERLERELEELKSGREGDPEYIRLKQENERLRQEVFSLRRGGGPPMYALPPGTSDNIRDHRVLTLSTSGCDIDGLPAAGSAVPSRASSFGGGATEYSVGFGSSSSYISTPEAGEQWQTVVPVSAVSVPSVVSSPCSSTGHPDDYVPAFQIPAPTSVPSNMITGSVMTSTAIPSCINDAKAEYEDIEQGKAFLREAVIVMDSTDRDQFWTGQGGFSQPSVPPSASAYAPQSWPMYPVSSYYDAPAI